jgi:DNA-binding XRE family transcriptional regulator
MTAEAFVNHRYRCGVACGNAAPYTRVGNEMTGASRAILLSKGAAMSEQTCTRDEFAADADARQTQVPLVRAEYLTEMRKQAGLTQAETADAMGVSQQRVSAIESGAVAELATLADYIRALGGELKVMADFGDLLLRVA